MPNPTRLLALLAAAFLVLAAPARAYWEYGHETVAEIAWATIQPETRAELARLMKRDGLLETPTCSASTLEEASVWPDCVKPLGDRYAYAYSWHYQNVEICAPFDLAAPCKDGNCVAAQIERNARLLADRDLPDRVRLEALAFLVHFVGDLHQPLHASDHGDLGGNRVAGNYGLIGGRTNLHSIWDGYLAERAISTPPRGVDGLLSAIGEVEQEAVEPVDVVAWSRQMWEQARTTAYPSLLGRDPCEEVDDDNRPTLSEEEVQRLIPVARLNVARGGKRLARLLDDAILEGKAPAYRRF
ncbi:S1/P1 nuclease [Sphingomicrobium nitratireducens]|uniref:S1/P1 nuclease n=1 Tax=Sphingomicrobium nitratireducens TaxID=2964666 RepID=UPI00223F4AB7|nr:S1/P1 nuclease [Sphingomicrobium nitratireducens]